MNAVPTIPAVKIKMMKASMRCLAFGLLALVPIIGLPFALVGLLSSFQARKLERYFWNPARQQRTIGLTCAALGALIWSVLDTLLVYNIINGNTGN